MKISSHKFYLPALLVLFFLGSYYYTFDPKIAQLGDNASYYMLGKALHQGEGYVNISKINKTPNNHYPPGYPAILSVGMIFSSKFVPLKMLNGLFLLGSVLLLFFLVRKLTESSLLAFVICLAMLGNYHIQQYSSLLMSEIPFLFFSLLSIFFLIRAEEGDGTLRNPYFWLSLVSASGAYYIRSLGIAILAGVILYLVIHKKWRYVAAYAGGFIILALPWFIRSQQLGGGSYTRQLKLINPYRPELGNADFSEFVRRFFDNISRYISTEIPYSIFPHQMPDYQASADFSSWIFGLLIIAVAIFGLWQIKRYRWLLLGYLLGTFGILMLWPDVWVGVRFMVPVIPFVLMAAFLGTYHLINRITTQAGKTLSPLWLMVPVVFMSVPLATLHDQAKVPLHPAWQNYYAMAEWLRENERPDVVVSCGKPSLFYLYSGTYTMRYAFEDEPEKLIRNLEEEKVNYVVLDQVYGNTIRYLLPAIKQYPERFEQVHYARNPDTFLLKFK